MGDSRYKELAVKFLCEPTITWDAAVRVVLAFEASSAARKAGNSLLPDTRGSGEPPAMAKLASTADTEDAVVRAIHEKYAKKIGKL